MAALFSVLLASLVGTSAASQSLRQAGQHPLVSSSHHSGGYVASMKFKHRLRVCNAYPNVATLDVYRGKTEKLTAEGGPMPYKTCREFREPLLAGDLLEFRGPTVADPLMAGVKTGGAYAGTFFVSDLPNNDAVMLLVIHRHDTLTTAAAFESHVFANLLNAQVAIIDVYKGRVQARPTIMDAGSKGARNEKLRFNSVVAVNPGVYEVDLDDMAGAQQAKNELVALNRESYVVLRVGAEAQEGPNFPEELVVFPKSDASELYPAKPKSAAASLTASSALLVLAVLVAALGA